MSREGYEFFPQIAFSWAALEGQRSPQTQKWNLTRKIHYN